MSTRGPKQKASDSELLEAYSETRSVWAVADRFKMCGQSVHGRLKKLNCVMSNPRWTTQDDDVLKVDYLSHADSGTLDVLAKRLGRTRNFICRKARSLGVTNKNRQRLWVSVWKHMATNVAKEIWDDFKRSDLGLGRYCESKGFDDLGFSKCMKKLFPDEWDHVIELKMITGPYAVGRRIEYLVRDDLRKRGYPIVLRSPLSYGPADVVAIKAGTTMLVQCKTKFLCGVPEWNSLYKLAQSISAQSVIAGLDDSGIVAYRKITGPKTGSNTNTQPWCDLIP